MRTSALLFSALLALLARPARAGPFGLVRPAPGEVLRMYSNMTVQADPAFSVAFDEDFPAFEVRLGGFALGNVTLSQLREGAVYALEPSVPVGMNELTVNATRACQNGTNCPSFRTYILPLTVRASRPITITPGDATGWQLAVASPASNGTTPSFRVGDAVPIRARTNLPDALPWNAVQTAPPGWPANLTAVQVYVGAVYAGSWAPSELAAGVNWTIPNGAFPQGGGFFTVALTGPKICNIVVTPKCAGARAVSGLSGAISVDGSYVSLVASATSTFASAASTTTFARTRTTGSAFTTITGAMFFTPAPPSANTPAAPASDPTADLPIPIGAIVGIVIGGIALIALLVFFGFWLRQHRLNQIEVETAKFLATAPKPGQFGGVTAFHRNSWREPDMDVLARTPGQRSAINLPNYGNVSISASKSAREF
ncbi:hypothetical protein DFJ74DRAFT_753432 [Hyaloraphidium curvatum]|nr:hypothetical protein DFJ74DRAFT_753432 [Hyaloraphidium curvatum]